METPANQPPRLKLAAPSGAAAAVGGEGPEWDWAAPWERPGATPRSTGSGPSASASSVQEELHPGARVPQASLGKAVDQRPALWWARHARPVLTGSGELGGTPLCPRPQRRAGQAFLGAAGPPWPERLHSHCCSVLRLVWAGRRLIAQGTSVAASGSAIGPLQKGTVRGGRVVYKTQFLRR